MKFSEADPSDGLPIRGYAPGRIRVGDKDYATSLIVTPVRVLAPWAPRSAAELAREHFETVLGLNPELIVLGTGERHQFPDPAIYAAVIGRGVGIEIMDTGAACRTYNILMSEGRRVAAALIML